MPDQPTTPAADEPRMKADVWAFQKRSPAWQLAAARLVFAWSSSQLLTEREFDSALHHVANLTSG